jgi:hypothetical protein
MTLRELLRRHHGSTDRPAAPVTATQGHEDPGHPGADEWRPQGHGSLHIQPDGRVGVDLRDRGRRHTEVTCALACRCGTTLAVSEVDPVGHMAHLACDRCGSRQSYRLPATMDLS